MPLLCIAVFAAAFPLMTWISVAILFPTFVVGALLFFGMRHLFGAMLIDDGPRPSCHAAPGRRLEPRVTHGADRVE